MPLTPAQIVNTRVCRKCGIEKPLDREHFYWRNDRQAWFSYCKACAYQQKQIRIKRDRESTNAYHRDWRKKNAAKRRQHAVKYMYGLTSEEHDAMLATQDNACAICRGPFQGGPRESVVPCVDHDHATGAVRGLLCHRCNHGLGHFKDSPTSLRAAADYLERS